MSNFLERTAFERVEIGMIVKTDSGLEAILGVSESTGGVIEITTYNLDTDVESDYTLQDVEVID
tara:strand:- start:313 stop:504 length:192 start_codon:yes stop_codon:yes gene_type:complete